MVKPNGRRVVLICGPPGSGKTTHARSLGLDIFDRDDPQWRGESHFVSTIKRLRNIPNAQAVVIRSGSRRATRRRTATLIGATQTIILDVDPETCIRRVIERARPYADRNREIAAVRAWWRKYLNDIDYNQARAAAESNKYDADYRRERKQYAKQVASGQAECVEPICLKTTRHIRPDEPWDLCHDPSGTIIIGPGHSACNRSEGARRGNQMRSGQPLPQRSWNP